MNRNDLSALQGQLKSPSTGSVRSPSNSVNLQFRNDLPIKIVVRHVDSSGQYDYSFPLIANNTTGAENPISSLPTTASDSFCIFSMTTGAFITTIQLGVSEFEAAETTPPVCIYPINSKSLNKPGDIGPIPQPSGDILIPSDSPHVVVGVGTLNAPGSPVIIREQFWKRQPDSYSLAAGETRTYSLNTVEGLQSTTSSETSLSSAAGFDASLGWGPFSASISASLSSDSTSFQQVVLNEQTTTYVSSTITNTSHTDQTYFRWQLTDMITFVSGDKMAGALISGASPVMISIH